MSRMAKLLSIYSIVMTGLFLFGVFTSFLWSADHVLLAPEIALLEPSTK